MFGFRRRRKTVLPALVAATCTLLGTPSGPSVASDTENEKKWKFDTALSYYGESDRVEDASANVLVRRAFQRGKLKLRLAVDTLTGASASGAVPAGVPQTFTKPSGSGSYTIAPGQTPLDSTFKDTRVALAASWRQPFGARNEIEAGVSFSNEYDYLHTGVNVQMSRWFNERNTTLTAGLGFADDSLEPVGGAPIPFAAMLPTGSTANKLGDDSKTVTDLLIGVSQVLGRRTIAQFNYSLSRSSGYLTDPYKLLSVIDPVTGNPVAGPGGLFLYRFENRPDERTKHSFFGQVKHRVGRNVLDGSYRYHTDDWGIDSHTVDFRWRRAVGEHWYVQPHVRYYTQPAADFYTAYLNDGDPLPDHASGDYRLGEFDGLTLGAKVGRSLGDGREWSARIEYYEQTGRGPPGSSVGSLAGFDLFPTVDAVIVQVGYRF